MIPNKIVARYQDGRIVKGSTADFMPNKAVFHIALTDSPPRAKLFDVIVKDLKAVFFVKDFVGNAQYNEKKDFDSVKTAAGRKIKVVFKDGEIMTGTTQGYQPGRPGFFVIPADPKSNIERFFVVSAAIRVATYL